MGEISRAEAVAREDLVMFINACLSCTGQREFYDSAYGQRVSLDFLHDYILGNYRRLYCQTLAAGINHFNQMQIILKLLASGKAVEAQHRAEENALITAALHRLPPHRAWKLLMQIRKRHINNRRSRAITKQYISSRAQNLPFQAIKYRSKLQAIATHNHLALNTLNPELNAFLFRQWQKSFETELFEKYRQGYYSASAIYNLPYTIAEGLAAKHQIPRDVFLERIAGQMTAQEKLRLQDTAARAGVNLKIDPHRLSLTKLALYILSLPLKERRLRRQELHDAMEKSARAVLKRSPLKLGQVVAVLDRSYSSSGSSEKRRRPLGIALAVHYLLAVSAQIHQQNYQAFWTVPIADAGGKDPTDPADPQMPLMVTPRGQTDLATPLLAALKLQPELVIVVSDGWENDPPHAAAELIRVYRQKLDPAGKTMIVHCNPVFNASDYRLKSISPQVPTVGLREAEDLSVVVRFARFAEGATTLQELEDFLVLRSQQFITSSPHASA